MSQVTNREVKVISEEMIEKIISYLHSLGYDSSDLTDHVCLPLAQWLHDEGFTIENTCYIISSIVNIHNIQEEIDNVYDLNYPPIHSKSDLLNFLGDDSFSDLEAVISPPKVKSNFTIDLNSDTK